MEARRPSPEVEDQRSENRQRIDAGVIGETLVLDREQLLNEMRRQAKVMAKAPGRVLQRHAKDAVGQAC
jgi:hypothetical protein